MRASMEGFDIAIVPRNDLLTNESRVGEMRSIQHHQLSLRFSGRLCHSHKKAAEALCHEPAQPYSLRLENYEIASAAAALHAGE